MANDKCDLRALKVTFDQSEVGKARRIEDIFKAKIEMQEKGIIGKGYNRRIVASIGTDGSEDKSEMCAVNSPFYYKRAKTKKCPEFIFNMGLSVPDALSLNLSKKTVKLTSDMKWLTVVIAVLTILLSLIGILQVLPQWQHIVKAQPNSDLKAQQTQTTYNNSKMRQIINPPIRSQTVPINKAPQKGLNEIHK